MMNVVPSGEKPKTRISFALTDHQRLAAGRGDGHAIT